MYFRLHIHKLHRLITRMALVSETTNIISCDAPTPKLWFSLLTFITYLGQMEIETGSRYLVPKPGSPANHYNYAGYQLPLINSGGLMCTQLPSVLLRITTNSPKLL